MYISRKYKTVTYENRCQIQEMLKTNKSITIMEVAERMNFEYSTCLLYTSDAADE